MRVACTGTLYRERGRRSECQWTHSELTSPTPPHCNLQWTFHKHRPSSPTRSAATTPPTNTHRCMGALPQSMRRRRRKRRPCAGIGTGHHRVYKGNGWQLVPSPPPLPLAFCNPVDGYASPLPPLHSIPSVRRAHAGIAQPSTLTHAFHRLSLSFPAAARTHCNSAAPPLLCTQPLSPPSSARYQ